MKGFSNTDKAVDPTSIRFIWNTPYVPFFLKTETVMLKTLIKRDLTQQNYTPTKINGWGEWSARNLGTLVDWNSIVMDTVSECPEIMTTRDLQLKLIQQCLDGMSWSHYLMAGRLYASLIHKDLFGKSMPTIKDLHTKLQSLGMMEVMNYTEEEYLEIETYVDHTKDFDNPEFALKQLLNKYALKNEKTNEIYESPQYIYIRMAMAICQKYTEDKLKYVKEFYEYFSDKILSAPTPNYLNLGTPWRGYASCCVSKANDTKESIAAKNHIIEIMTAAGAGQGGMLDIRSLGDPVRKGRVIHNGKLPRYRALNGLTKSNTQAGRAGAYMTYYNAYDPEVETIIRLGNAMSADDKRIRGIDYSFCSNEFFDNKANENKDIFLFNCFTAPDLFNAMYKKDQKEFEALYNKYENDPNFHKEYVNARKLALESKIQARETGRHTRFNITEANRHTPFKDPIYSSNLCTEIFLPTNGYENVAGLYTTEDHGKGEIALCNLAAINAAAVDRKAGGDRNKFKQIYAKAAELALRMIDVCIHLADYPFPHLGMTAKARMSAGVGIMGYAEYLAKYKKKYSDPQTYHEHHFIAELHQYSLLEASLDLGKKYGNAPWMHKTLWPEGWLPIDTYNKNIDKYGDFKYEFDWENLRARIIANKGLRFSVHSAQMPGESSSKALGTTNADYPVRKITLLKTDEKALLDFAAPYSDNPDYEYETSFNVGNKHLIIKYGITQKFFDQGGSCDLYEDNTNGVPVTSTKLLNEYLFASHVGLKSSYYYVTKTSDNKGTSISQSVFKTDKISRIEDQVGKCKEGFCSL